MSRLLNKTYLSTLHDYELSIFQLNARSVRNKLSYVEDIASESSIICVTESHLDTNMCCNITTHCHISHSHLTLRILSSKQQSSTRISIDISLYHYIWKINNTQKLSYNISSYFILLLYYKYAKAIECIIVSLLVIIYHHY
jgi:hypothetical protein